MSGEETQVEFLIPVYNEGANIARALEELDRLVPIAKRALVIHDTDEDDTVPVVGALREKYPWASTLRNDRGRGVLHAIRAGIDAATCEIVVISMADLSDDVAIVPRMAAMIRDEGYDVVCASRYMKGGRQIGGPRFKKFLSRTAGVTLAWLTGIPTHDATNAFRAYRLSVLRRFPIESTGGFEYTLEITAKAYAAGCRIGEVPSTWRDRTAGASRFRLWRWLPRYLRWYLYALTHRPPRSTTKR